MNHSTINDNSVTDITETTNFTENPIAYEDDSTFGKHTSFVLLTSVISVFLMLSTIKYQYTKYDHIERVSVITEESYASEKRTNNDLLIKKQEPTD